MVEKPGRISKDFLRWSKLKIELQNNASTPFFYEREIWWVSLGHNLGFEEDGKGARFARPVLIFRKFNRQLFWGVPLTSTERHGRYYFYFHYEADKTNTALLSQLRALDSRRLLDKHGVMSRANFKSLQLKLTRLMQAEAR
jgi:mRNA interferase MazF